MNYENLLRKAKNDSFLKVKYEQVTYLRTKEFEQQNGNMSFGAVNVSFLL